MPDVDRHSATPLGDAKVMAFVPTTAPERATAFYRDVLGLRFVADEPHALVFESGGTMLRVVKVRDLTPQVFTVLGWEVDDIESAVDVLVARGASALRVRGMEQDARGIWDPGGGANATTSPSARPGSADVPRGAMVPSRLLGRSDR